MPPPRLQSLDDDVLRLILAATPDCEQYTFALLCRRTCALVREHRHGIVLHLPPGQLLNQKQIAAAFPRFHNSMLPPSLQSKLTHTGFHFDRKRCLPAILECYGGWKGMAERRRAVAERAQERIEKRKAAQAYRAGRLDAYIASSPRIAFSGLHDWRRSLAERRLAPPEADSVLNSFLGCGTAPPSIFQARSAMEAHERAQSRVLVRRTALVHELLKIKVENCGRRALFIDFCERGCLQEAPDVAQRLAREVHLAGSRRNGTLSTLHAGVAVTPA